MGGKQKFLKFIYIFKDIKYHNRYLMWLQLLQTTASFRPWTQEYNLKIV